MSPGWAPPLRPPVSRQRIKARVEHALARHFAAPLLFALLAWLASPPAAAAIRVQDDRGVVVELPAPAQRIVSLAPHVTELLFAAGAGDRIVGTTEFSDYPAPAKAIPRVSSSSMLDLERVLTLKPDVIVVWSHGTPQAQLDRLRALGLRLFHIDARHLGDIPRELEALGQLAGTEAVATKAAGAFASRLGALRQRWANERAVTVFWQVWSRPLLTINGDHIFTDAIELCGGRNVFAQLKALVPTVSMESVIDADPDAMVTTTSDAASDGSDGLENWRALKSLRVTRERNFVVLEAETIHRASPRILDGVANLCEKLHSVRMRSTR
jgi:iron complex transport system substrate-binding protein